MRGIVGGAAEPSADSVRLLGRSMREGEYGVAAAHAVPGDLIGRIACMHARGSERIIDRVVAGRRMRRPSVRCFVFPGHPL